MQKFSCSSSFLSFFQKIYENLEIRNSGGRSTLSMVGLSMVGDHYFGISFFQKNISREFSNCTENDRIVEIYANNFIFYCNKINPILKILVLKNSCLLLNFDFRQTFRFWTKNSISEKNLYFREKFGLSTKFSIFDKNFDFRQKFRLSTKISIFDKNFDKNFNLR